MPVDGFKLVADYVNASFDDNGTGMKLTESGKMGVDLVSQGGGYVGFTGYKDDSKGEFVCEIIGLPFEGNAFGVWYDEMADIFSAEDVVDITDSEPPLGETFVLSATFGRDSSLLPFYEGDAPKASSEVIQVKPGTPVTVDIDGDGKEDTICLVNQGETEGTNEGISYSVQVTLGSEPEKTLNLQTYDYIYECSLYVIDCDVSDDRLELLFWGITESEGYYITAWRMNDSGSSIAAYPINVGAELLTDENGSFDPSNGIPLCVYTNLLDTQGVTGLFTITNEGFRLLSPLRFDEPAEYNHGFRALLRDMEVTVIKDGVPGEKLTLDAGTKICPYETDLWSYVDLLLEDGSIVRAEIKIKGGYQVFINGDPQDEYCDIWYAG